VGAQAERTVEAGRAEAHLVAGALTGQ
jgi:hypothetical protein